MERLNKLIARSGVASRRAADDLIRSGRVAVNGSIVTELGTRVDPVADAIKVDGKRIAAPASHVYYALHKPDGCVTTLSDPEGRPTIRDLLRGVRKGVYPVGRLDYHSEGLLLVTDDGDLARALTHPSTGVPRTYRVKVKGHVKPETLVRLRGGIRLDGRPTGPIGARMVRGGANSWCEVTVREGRKHFVRLLFRAVGHPVLRLRRMAFGGVELGRLARGQHRALSESEVARLREWLAPGSGRRSPRRRPGRRN